MLGLDQGYWIDEVVSVQTARLHLADLLHRVGFFDLHPPVYYLVLSAWREVFSDGEVSTRFLSLLFAGGTLVVLLAWGRKTNTWVGFAALLLLGFSAFHTHYSVEVRSYSLLAFLGTSLLYLYERLCAKSETRPIHWALLLICELTFVLSHYYAVLLVAAMNVHFFTYRRMSPQRLFKWSMVQGLSAVAFLLWLPLLLVQLFHLPEGMFAHLKETAGLPLFFVYMGPSTSHPSTLVAWGGAALFVAAVLKTMVGAVMDRERHGEPVDTPAESGWSRKQGLMITCVLLLALLAPSAAAGVIKVTETTLPLLLQELPRCYIVLCAAFFFLLVGNLTNSKAVERGHGIAPAPFIAALTLVLFAVMYAINRAFLPRNLIFLLPLCCLLAATAWVPRKALSRAALTVLIISMTVPSLARMEQVFEPRQNFKEAARFIGQMDATEGIANFVLPMWDRPGIEFYLGTGTANGLMSTSQFPPVPTLPGTVNLVLTRQAFDRRRAFLESAVQALGPEFNLEDDAGAFKRVYVAVFTRNRKGVSK